MLWTSLPDALRKLDPRTLWRNPVMFIVEIGAVWSTILAIAAAELVRLDDRVLAVADRPLRQPRRGGRRGPRQGPGRLAAEGQVRHRGRADGWQRTPVPRRRSPRPRCRRATSSSSRPAQVIPGDGDVVEGIASVDESAITGESAPVIRESGGDRSAVTGGTTVLSDRIVVRITQKPGESFVDRMIALVEGANRQKTPNEIALNILLAALTIIFVFAVATLQPLAIFSKANNPGVPDTLALDGDGVTGIVMVALLVCLIPTTIGALLSAIGIAGMDRLVQRNVLAMSGRAVEAAGDVNTLLLDKTGTITLGNRQASEFIPLPGVTPEQLADAAQLSSLADETPEGRSIVVYAKQAYGLRARTPGELDQAHLGRIHRDDPDVGCRPRERPAAAQGRGRFGRGMGARPRRHRPAGTRRASSTASPRRAAPRWWSARPPRDGTAARCSASSTSRTSSSRACGNGSTRCAGWASAR